MEQEAAAEEERLKPIFYQIPVTSSRTLCPTDLLYDGSQYYLVKSVDSEVNNKVSAFIVGRDNKVKSVHNIILVSSSKRIEIESDLNKTSDSSRKRVIKAAEEQIFSEWVAIPRIFCHNNETWHWILI